MDNNRQELGNDRQEINNYRQEMDNYQYLSITGSYYINKLNVSPKKM